MQSVIGFKHRQGAQHTSHSSKAPPAHHLSNATPDHTIVTNDLPTGGNPIQQEYVVCTVHQIRFDVINIAIVKVSAIENQAHTHPHALQYTSTIVACPTTYFSLQWFQQNSIGIAVVVGCGRRRRHRCTRTTSTSKGQQTAARIQTQPSKRAHARARKQHRAPHLDTIILYCLSTYV